MKRSIETINDTIDMQPQRFANILCCMCGTSIQPNPSNMCVSCLRGQVDITEGICKQVIMHYCKECNRYLRPPWMHCELESRELLSVCLKKIKGLNKVKLVDASFIWTEPHSRRIKVKLTIQKEVLNGAILQQTFVVEFLVQTLQCDDCKKLWTPHTWVASCQVRQKVDHKRTFFFLEQLILKHNAHEKTLNVKEETDGIDFYFANRSHAMKFVDFLQGIVPVRVKDSKQLISQDDRSNTYNYKYSFSVEIAMVCKDDLVVLPSKLAPHTGNAGPLMLVHKISNIVMAVDPMTLRAVEIPAGLFWKHPFKAAATRKHLTEYTILNVDPVEAVHQPIKQGAATRTLYQLADVECARVSDFGRNDIVFRVRTHLGHLLKPGDSAMGYDMTTINFLEDDDASIRRLQVPEVILVKKHYPNRRKQNKKRNWKLQHLQKEESDMLPRERDVQKTEKEYEEFLQDLEEDPELRSNVNLFKEAAAPVRRDVEEMEDAEYEPEEDFPEVGVEELLDGLTLNDPDEEDEQEVQLPST
eukprot:GILJ01002430.1.p1 GENE.GILJ01002430.1~~GILJ01002430.1.p1  ORF type:complete len:528 (+),score=93.79 GILJ01002430.1:79-1662(+)